MKGEAARSAPFLSRLQSNNQQLCRTKERKGHSQNSAAAVFNCHLIRQDRANSRLRIFGVRDWLVNRLFLWHYSQRPRIPIPKIPLLSSQIWSSILLFSFFLSVFLSTRFPEKIFGFQFQNYETETAGLSSPRQAALPQCRLVVSLCRGGSPLRLHFGQRESDWVHPRHF